MRSRLVILGLVRNSFGIFIDVVMFCRLCLRSPAALAAENLFLRKQLGLYVERKTKPRRATDAVRFTLAQLSRFFDWRNVLTVVKPDTLIRWHRKGFRLFWKWKSKSHVHNPRLAPEVIALIKEMALANRLWGAIRIRDELLKLGITVSKRTMQKYMRQARRGLPVLAT